MHAEHGKAINILLVEDSLADAALTEEAFSHATVAHRLYAVRDGLEALEFLHRQGNYAEAPQPDLVLLDLNLPRKDGRTVLEEIKADPRLAAIPVIVLTNSTDDRDILQAYASHANCYIAKPLDFAQFMNVVRIIESFWLTVVRLPGAA